MTLKSGLEITQGHSNRYHSKASVQFPIIIIIIIIIIIMRNFLKWPK